MSDTSGAPAIEARNVFKIFKSGFWMRNQPVLQDVSLVVPRGSIFGFVGENGAGKTTLIQMIVGVTRPTRGEVLVSGQPADGREARSRIGYLPERSYFHEHLTGFRFLRYMGDLSGMDRAELERRIPVVLARVGLSHAGKTELRHFSKGMLQRIGIAQAILHDPEVLVLDEPMSGLDPIGRRDMRELILGLAAERKTVFFSSHVIPDVEAICTSVGVIRRGQIVGSGPIGGFLSKGPLRTELGVQGIAAEDLRSIPDLVSCQPMPDGFRVLVTGQEAVSRSLAKLLALRATVLWVTPIRPTLEELFSRERTTAP